MQKRIHAEVMGKLLSGLLEIQIINSDEQLYQLYRDSLQQEFKQDINDATTKKCIYLDETIDNGLQNKLADGQRRATSLVLLGSEMSEKAKKDKGELSKAV